MAILLAGVALGEARPRLWRVGIAYAGGMFVTYLLLGLGIISVVSFFASTHLPVRLMGLVVVALGLWMLKDAIVPEWGWPLTMPARLHGTVRKVLAQTAPGGLFLAGGLVGLCTVPCSGAIYLGVLGMIAAQPIATRLMYLVTYNLAFIAPLLGLLAIVANRRSLNRIGHWYLPRRLIAKAILGVLAVGLGLVVLVTA